MEGVQVTGPMLWESSTAQQTINHLLLEMAFLLEAMASEIYLFMERNSLLTKQLHDDEFVESFSKYVEERELLIVMKPRLLPDKTLASSYEKNC